MTAEERYRGALQSIAREESGIWGTIAREALKEYASDTYRLWVDRERTILVRQWTDGALEIATRDDPGATWGPPIELEEEV